VDNLFPLIKGLHILGVILFVGNIVVTAWWKLMADRTKDPRIVGFAQRQVTATDFLFTVTGVALILLSGFWSAWLAGIDYWQTRWLAWGIGLFGASGAIWIIVLLPIQIEQARLARSFASDGPIPERYWKLSRRWAVWGTIATVLPLANLYWMVFKPA
jgi:uncharacterized membrane protein